MELKYRAFRYFAYSLEILIFYVISGVPNVIPQLFGGKPCLLIPIALSIAVFENEKVAMIFGAVCGLLTDFGFSNSVGYYAIFLAIICFFVGFFSDNLIVGSLQNTLIIGFIAITVIIGLYFVFFYIFTGFENLSAIFLKRYVSKIVYTFVFVPVFYYLNRLLYFGIHKKE